MANEKRLIDANALIEALPIVTEDRKITLYGAVADFMIMISAMPTVDAVEVVHGRWLNWRGEPISPDDYWRLHRCSVCGNEWEFPEAVDTDEVGFNYCPNCGAKMDGDGNA